MNTQGLLIIFGSLALVVVAVVFGYAMTPAPWAKALLALGIVGAIAWVGFALWIANAMNTDI